MLSMSGFSVGAYHLRAQTADSKVSGVGLVKE